ncbi:MerR family transcriptional regulator [Streptomyces anulatus]|uniref:MerR family transcriptional regulator n=1 Tax=Streptomyces TaxID=1883 RepID=UPI000AE28BAD|nr:MerR family transcriptional regulator [Streptomyces sp. TSRI0395]
MRDLYSIGEVAEAFGLTVATLRFYEERGLVQHSERRARVRHYRRADLARLAYAQLWHEDGLLTLAETSAIVDSDRLGDRLALIATQREALRARIGKMERAVGVLTHMLDCRTDRALECPMTGAYVRGRVDAALDGTPEPTGFWPEGHAGLGPGHVGHAGHTDHAGLAGLAGGSEAMPGTAAPEPASRSIGDERLLALTRNLVAESAETRERACGTICDWVRSFDRREVRTLASLLASAAVLEQDAACLESELNALGELSTTGLFETSDIAALRRLPRESVRPGDVGHLDDLMEQYF